MTDPQIKPGMKVHYAPLYGDKENGIVKALNHDNTRAWVVYHCNKEWHRYDDYTGQSTNIKDLKIGWI